MNKPTINLSDCVLCEICVELCPEIFKINAVGFVEVADIKEYNKKRLKEAAKNCPENCISFES
ncbi:MAG: ferredoxin [Deltaproteobacteria bacterium]|nr:ferredoxin [Deltaproteobacteria bacterium]